MEIFSGYKYETKGLAQVAQSQCKKIRKLPVQGGGTLEWVKIHTNNNFWYIIAHESLIGVLGQPQQIEITI